MAQVREITPSSVVYGTPIIQDNLPYSARSQHPSSTVLSKITIVALLLTFKYLTQPGNRPAPITVSALLSFYSCAAKPFYVFLFNDYRSVKFLYIRWKLKEKQLFFLLQESKRCLQKTLQEYEAILSKAEYLRLLGQSVEHGDICAGVEMASPDTSVANHDPHEEPKPSVDFFPMARRSDSFVQAPSKSLLETIFHAYDLCFRYDTMVSDCVHFHKRCLTYLDSIEEVHNRIGEIQLIIEEGKNRCFRDSVAISRCLAERRRSSRTIELGIK